MSQLEKKVEILEVKLDAVIALIGNLITNNENSEKIIDNNFTLLNNKIESLDRKISSLHGNVDKGFKDVQFELVKIQKTTGYEAMYDNLKVVGDE